MAVWLVSYLAVDALHAFTHDICANAQNQPHPCLTCQLHNNPTQAHQPEKLETRAPLEYAETHIRQPLSVQLKAQSSPQPLVPRGPPA